MVVKKRIKPSKSLIFRRLYALHKDILVIYRKDNKDGWSNRCKLYSKEYNAKTPYNHRNILPMEIVLEYDLDKELNNTFANKVWDRLHKSEYNIKCAKFCSGNKSKHIHIFLDIPEGVTDIPTLKRVFMRYFGVFYHDRVNGRYYFDKSEIKSEYNDMWVNKKDNKDFFIEKDRDMVNTDLYESRIVKVYPDMQLAASHPIRAEWGLHEKTGHHKTLEKWDDDYIKLQKIPEIVLSKYAKEKVRLAKYNMTKAINANLENDPLVKDILNTVKFKENMDDGRERLMFCLIHILKAKYNKEELKTLLFDWYRYSGGRKMNKSMVDRKVEYHYVRNYTITLKYLKTVVEEVSTI